MVCHYRTARRQPSLPACRWLLLAALLTWGAVPATRAQQPPRVHYLHHEFLPPGAIGQEQLRRHPGMPGYVQAVELIPPEGAQVSLLQSGAFRPAPVGPVLAGMQLGYVYTVKLTGLPNRSGVEVFPTVELVNRLYPPEGTKTRFPVPIEFSEQDIAQALSGLFVTRVVYLEDSDKALPVADEPGRQRAIDVAPTEDPLHVADRLGRPMAIVRIGSRIPDEEAVVRAESWFPAIQLYPAPAVPSNIPRNIDEAIERQGADIPRDARESAPRGAFLRPDLRFR